MKYSPSSRFFFCWGEALVPVGSAVEGESRGDFGVKLNSPLHLLGPTCLPLLALPRGSSGQGSSFLRKFSSSVRRSLPGQAQMRTSKLSLPRRFPLSGTRKGAPQGSKKAGPHSDRFVNQAPPVLKPSCHIWSGSSSYRDPEKPQIREVPKAEREQRRRLHLGRYGRN